MKLPKSIMVYGVEYRVDVIKLDRDHHGFCYNQEDPHIEIAKRLKHKDRPQVFFHECIHAVIHRTGIIQGLEDGIEEAICQSIAQWLDESFEIKPRKIITKK